MNGEDRPRHRKPLAWRLAVVVCAGLALTACASTGDQDRPSALALDSTVGAGGHDRPGAEGASDRVEAVEREDAVEPEDAAPEPLPVTVEIPAIGVEVDLVSLGLNDDRSMEVPDFGLAGWYAKGPRPGAAGPAVIVAHYDSTDGPDVFYELDALEAGDAIHVRREDGSVATFVVEDLEQHPKESLPGDRIWATSTQPRLTLITCGGVFDRTTGHYTDNVIVYASG